MSPKKSFTVKDLPKEARPRERIIGAGARSLSDKELLAAVLGSGISGESVLLTVSRLLGRFKNLGRIASASIEELTAIKGIGVAKAAQIKAAFELGKRVGSEYSTPTPFVKWAGGKNQLIEQYSVFFPHVYNRYFEPFVGGGAIFFHLKPKKAVLSDLNKDLIKCYKVVKSNSKELVSILRKYQEKHGRSFFYDVRDRFNSDKMGKIERAAAFIYLNKAGFNGLYRVNSRGEFNTPFGAYKNPSIFDEENIFAVSKLLAGVECYAEPFDAVLERARAGDFVYFDPPYYPLNRTSNFTSYTKENFLEAEQEHLAEIFRSLDKRGCKVMLSNSDTKFIKKLYKGYRVEAVRANRFINSVGDKRGAVNELVILNY